jgi:hypothetical protein
VRLEYCGGLTFIMTDFLANQNKIALFNIQLLKKALKLRHEARMLQTIPASFKLT